MKFQGTRALLATSAVATLFLVGCNGGSSNSGGIGNPTPTATTPPVPGPNVNVYGLLDDNRLVSFNASNPGSSNTITISGVPAGQTLVGIDYRFAPDAAGQAGLYGLVSRGGTNYGLFRIAVSGSTATATPIGAGFSAALDPLTIGFDFNPQVPSPTNATVRVDRIRVVSGNRLNLRLAPNTGALVDGDPDTAGTQLDGTLTYDTSDPRNGTIPRIVGAAYTNNAATASPSGTINYGIDVTTSSLVTQGRPASGANAAVSPNTGRLFTVGALGVTVGNRTSFDIGPGASNTALLVNNVQLSTVNLSTGRASVIGDVEVPTGRVLLGLAIVPASI